MTQGFAFMDVAILVKHVSNQTLSLISNFNIKIYFYIGNNSFYHGYLSLLNNKVINSGIQVSGGVQRLQLPSRIVAIPYFMKN